MWYAVYHSKFGGDGESRTHNRKGANLPRYHQYMRPHKYIVRLCLVSFTVLPLHHTPIVWWERMDSNHDQSLMMRMKVIIAAQSLIQIWRGYGESNPEHVIDSHVL